MRLRCFTTYYSKMELSKETSFAEALPSLTSPEHLFPRVSHQSKNANTNVYLMMKFKIVLYGLRNHAETQWTNQQEVLECLQIIFTRSARALCHYTPRNIIARHYSRSQWRTSRLACNNCKRSWRKFMQEKDQPCLLVVSLLLVQIQRKNTRWWYIWWIAKGQNPNPGIHQVMWMTNFTKHWNARLTKWAIESWCRAVWFPDRSFQIATTEPDGRDWHITSLCFML